MSTSERGKVAESSKWPGVEMALESNDHDSDASNHYTSAARYLDLGLKALASVSALASDIWPRPSLGLQQKSQQSRRDWPVCFPTTGHHAM